MKRFLGALALQFFALLACASAQATEIPSTPPFQPSGHYVAVTATPAGAVAALPTGGSQVVVYNQGDVDAVVTLGPSTLPPTPSLTGDVVAAHGFFELTIGANSLIAVETASGSAPLVISAGVGQAAAGGARGISASQLPVLNGDGGALAHITNLPATQAVSATALPLPAGAATSAGQPALNGDGGSLAHITNLPATQAVSATALPLPAGAATSAGQSAIVAALGTPLQAGGAVADANSAAFVGAVAMTPGTTYAAARSVRVIATVAGNVVFQFPDASTLTEAVYVGAQTFPYACTQIVSAGTTASATYFNLK